MRYHEKVVHIGLRFPCAHCDFKSSTEEQLKQHIESVHVAMKPKLETNSKPGTPVQQLQQVPQHDVHQHEMDQLTASGAPSSIELGGIQPRSPEENVVGPFQCPSCNYITNRKMSLKKHIDAVHEKVKHPCEKCDFKASSKGSLNKHYQVRIYEYFLVFFYFIV